jgi:hypothetical protein
MIGMACSVSVVFALVLSLSGCGQRSSATGASVSGKVLFNGVPVSGGDIKFHPKQGPPYTGNLNAQGEFSHAGVPIMGEVIVTIDTRALKDIAAAADPTDFGKMGNKGAKNDAKAKETMSKMKDKMPAGMSLNPAAGKSLTYVEIPAKYADPKTSGLTWEIKSGPNEKTFELTK